MSVTIELPAAAQARLEAEAARRGITLEQLIAQLADQLPAEDPLDAFIGCGNRKCTHRYYAAMRAAIAQSELQLAKGILGQGEIKITHG